MTNKAIKALVATAVTALLVAGCSTSSETEAPETSTSTSTSTSSTTTTPPTTSETPEPTPEPEPAPEPAPESVAAPAYTAPAAPTFAYCYLADGTAMMSDGTTTYMDSCNESAGGPYLLEDGTSIYDAFPEQYENLTPDQLASDRAWSDCIEAGGTSESCSAN